MSSPVSSRRPVAVLARWFVKRTVDAHPDAEPILGDFEERAAQSRAGAISDLHLLRDALEVCLYWRRRQRTERRAGGHEVHRRVQQELRSHPRRNQETHVNQILEDVAAALRMLWRRRGFKTAVLLTLGIGIGATTTIYSVVDAVLLRPLPFADADRLVVLGTTFPDREWRSDGSGLQHLAGVSVANFADWRERSRSFDELVALEARGVLLPDVGRGLEVGSAAAVSAQLLETLGAGVHLGRLFRDDDFRAGAEPVRLLSYSTWQERYGGDPDIVNSPTAADAEGLIVGVLEPGFELPEAIGRERPQIWWPLIETSERYANRGRRSAFVFGRLADGVSVDAARSEMSRLAEQLADEFPEGNVLSDGQAFGAGVNDLKQETVGAASRVILVFFAASGLLLLVALLNSTHLLLVRSLARRRELQVRQALGAGQGRLTRLLVTESVALSLVGGALGVVIARLGVEAFVRLSPRSMPRLDEVAIDLRVLAVTVGMSILVGLLGGIFASFGLAGRPHLGALRTAGGADATFRGRSALVIGQLALAVVLLIGASLLLTSFLNVVAFEPGFEPEGLWTFSATIKRPGNDGEQSISGRWEELLSAVRSVPGVEGVAAASNLPFQDPNWAPAILTPGQSREQIRGGVAGYVITPEFLDVAEVPVLRGRTFDQRDNADSTTVTLVNRTFALERLGTLDVVGETLRRVRDDDTFEELQIVGLVGDVVRNRAEEGYRPALYFPYTQQPWPRAWVALRTADSSGTLDLTVREPLRSAVARVNPVAPTADLGPMTERIRTKRVEPLFRSSLLGAFAMVATLLAALGLYGSLSHLVSRRRREIGIRIALGAENRRVLSLVAGHGLRLMAIGMSLGLLLSLAATRVLQAQLFGVSPTSALPVLAGVVVLLGVGLVATVAPARSAARTDPTANLRAD